MAMLKKAQIYPPSARNSKSSS